jgi:hypothetical protein
MPRQGNDSASREAVVARFDRVTDVIEAHWPSDATFRLPSPRGGVVVVEIPLDLLEKIVLAAIRPER